MTGEFQLLKTQELEFWLDQSGWTKWNVMKDWKHWSTHGGGVTLAEGARFPEDACLEKNTTESSKSWAFQEARGNEEGHQAHYCSIGIIKY